MKLFFLGRTIIGVTVTILISAVTLLTISLVASMSSNSDGIEALIFITGMLVNAGLMLPYLLSTTSQNLSWLTTLPVSKTRIWLTHWVSSMLILAAGTVSFLAAVDVWQMSRRVDHVHKTLSIFGSVFDFLTRLELSDEALAGGFLLWSWSLVAGTISVRPATTLTRAVIINLCFAIAVMGLASIGSTALVAMALVLWGIVWQLRDSHAQLGTSFRSTKLIAPFIIASIVPFAILPNVASMAALRGDDASQAHAAASWLGPMAHFKKAQIIRLMKDPTIETWEFSWLLGRPEFAGSRQRDHIIDPDDPEFPLRDITAIHQDEPEIITRIVESLAGRGHQDDLSWLAAKLDAAVQMQQDPGEPLRVNSATNHAVKLAATTLTLVPLDEISQELIPRWLLAGEVRAGAAIVMARWVPSQEILTLIQERQGHWQSASAVGLRDLAFETMTILSGRRLTRSDIDGSPLKWNSELARRCKAERATWCPRLSACSWGQIACILDAFDQDMSLANVCLRLPRNLLRVDDITDQNDAHESDEPVRSQIKSMESRDITGGVGSIGSISLTLNETCGRRR